MDKFDIFKLLRYYRRYAWLMILVPTIAVTVTYYFVRDLPDLYEANTVISTGMTDAAKYTGLAAASQMRQTYSNMIGMVRMKRVLDRVSYRLALHDLEDVQGRFQPSNSVFQSLTESKRQSLISTIRSNLVENIPLLPDSANRMVFDFVSTMGYDHRFIENNMNVSRYGESDFLGIKFWAEQPELAAFTANALATEFIQYYGLVTSQSGQQSVSTLDSLLKEKERFMQEKNNQLRDYRINSGILNSSTHSGMLYSQVSSVEAKRSDKLTEIESIQGAMAEIRKLLNDPNEGYSLSSTVTYNNEIIELDRKLEIANRQYIDNNFQNIDKKLIDSLQEVKRRVVANAAANSPVGNPKQTRQQLQQQLTNLQTQLSAAQQSLRMIDSELASARSRYSSMVPKDATLHNLERDAELATNEYTEALNRYNQAGFVSNVNNQLSIVEVGLPGPASQSKKIVYMGMSGVASFFLSLAVVTLLCLTDRRINNAQELKQASGIDTAISLNYIKDKEANVRDIWENAESNRQYALYRDQLRTLRFDLNKEFERGKCGVLAITSLGIGEGKSFVSGSLAYAFAMTGKKVLLIGEDTRILNGNPKGARNADGSDDDSPNGQQFETFLIERKIQTEDLITNLRRNERHGSILERQDNENLMAGFKLLKEKFDVIIVDVGSFTSVNYVKEWLMFSDISLAVFEVGRTLNASLHGYVEYLKQYPGFKGWVLNKVVTRLSAKSA
mgnify:CR=1 FL=1